jgi:hypothetical protein
MKIQENTPNTGGHEVTRSKESNYSGKALKSGVVILTILVICIGWHLGARSDRVVRDASSTTETSIPPFSKRDGIGDQTGIKTSTESNSHPQVNTINSGNGTEQQNHIVRNHDTDDSKKLESLIHKVKKYKELAERILEKNPELREIPSLIKWLERLADSNYSSGRMAWQQMAKESNDIGEKLFKIMHLMKPAAMLAMMEDVRFGGIMQDSYEVAGLKNLADADLSALDQLADVKDYIHPSLNYAQFKLALEVRERAYSQVADDISATLPTPLTDEIKNFMFAEIQKRTMIPYLRSYYDSFFTNEILDLVNEIKTERGKLPSNQSSLNLPSSTLKELDDLIRSSPPLPKF